MSIITIGESPNYRILIGTGSMYVQEFYVRASNKTDALSLVANYCVEYDLHWLYADYCELADLCSANETVAEYALHQDLTACSKDGIYMQIKGIKEL